VIPFCEQNGIAVVAYSPFGHDSFPAANSAGGKVLGEIASKHRASPRQVALAFLTRQPMLFTIPKASSPEHAEDNAAAGKLKLSADEIARIDRAFPRGPKPRSLPML
jgi:diketogulonate reductase-like aldo/keto reductase